MECCVCDKVIDLSKKEEYEYDFVGDTWCKSCMEEEVEWEHKAPI